jgi:site-specific recombinase XerD
MRTDPMSESITGFSLWLATEGRPKAPETIRIYTRTVRELRSWARQRSVGAWEDITKAHVRAFIAGIRERGSDAYAATNFSGCRSFFAYMEAEEWEGTRRSPMASMTAPTVTEPLVPVLTRGQLGDLVAAARRSGPLDEAIIRLLADTGLRLSEIAGLRLDDLDLGTVPRILVKRGKGGKPRWVVPGGRTVLALRRYLRHRAGHPSAKSEALWLGHLGPMTKSGIYKRVAAVGERAGVTVHPHLFRHVWAHSFRLAGGPLDDLVHLAGWKGPRMALRYGKSAAGERAEITARRISLGDRI